MQAYPGRGNPLMDALNGRISVRQLRVMLEHLPENNPIQWEFNGNQWDDKAWIAWNNNTMLRFLRAEYFNAHRPKGKEPWEPELLPNPKQAQQKNDPRTPEQIEAERDHFRAILNRKVVK